MWKPVKVLAFGLLAAGGSWAAFRSPCLTLFSFSGAAWVALPHWRRDHLASFLRLQTLVALVVILALILGFHAPKEVARWGIIGSLCVSMLHGLMVGASNLESRFARCACIAGMALVLVLSPVLTVIHPPRKRIQQTPEAVGLRYRNIVLRTIDGLDLRGWEVGHDKPRAVVIFSHGFGENRSQALNLLNTLHDLSCTVVAIDFRGHGDSAGTTATFGFNETRDIHAACEYVSHRFGELPILLVGVSYGAAVTLQAAPTLPNIHGIWVEAPFARFIELAEHRFAWLPRAFRRPLLDVYYLVAYCESGVAIDQVEPAAAVDTLTVPIAWTHANDDTLIPIEQSQRMHAAYGGEKRCFWVDEATHWNLQAVAGEAYRSRLRAFVDDVLKPPVLFGGRSKAIQDTIFETHSGALQTRDAIP